MKMSLEFPHKGTYPLYERVLKCLIGEPMKDKTLIDLCSRESPFIQHYPLKKKTYVDATNDFTPPKDGEFWHMDVFRVPTILNEDYDIATCLDGIEHLPKILGWDLLSMMDNISDKQILFTPLGDYLVEPDSQDPKTHKCGWHPEELSGYASIVFPNYHGTFGAFFFWKCPNTRESFMQVATELGDLAGF